MNPEMERQTAANQAIATAEAIVRDQAALLPPVQQARHVLPQSSRLSRAKAFVKRHPWAAASVAVLAGLVAVTR